MCRPVRSFKRANAAFRLWRNFTDRQAFQVQANIDPSWWEMSSCHLKHIVEIARIESIARNSEPVLCERFYPWLDLMVSSDEAPHGFAETNFGGLDARMCELTKLIEASDLGIDKKETWCSAWTSIGVVRWWHVEHRDKAISSFAPFALAPKFVVTCPFPAPNVLSTEPFAVYLTKAKSV